MGLENSADASLRNLLEWQALHAPSSAAILAPGRPALTYGEWYRVYRDAARELQSAGISSNDRLAVVIPNGPEMAAAMVVLSSIAVVAPINPASRGSELERAFRDLGATGVVVPDADGHAARSAALRLKLPLIELIPERGGPAGAFTLRCEHWTSFPSTYTNEAGVIVLARTSGTTAAPKVIALTSANLLSAAKAVSSVFALKPKDRCLQAQSTFHAVSTLTLVASMRAGSSIVYLPRFDFDALCSSLCDDDVTWLSAPPATYREILAHMPARREVARAAKLRFLRSGSAALEADVWEQLERVFEAPLLQAYGMTEAPFISCCPLPPLPQKVASAGLPQGCEIAIVDDAGQHLGSGQMGEVLVRGPNVMRGYDDPAANAEAFTDGWFRTGDLGRCDDDGYLYLLGRRKELINRGGEKIFPREIEDVLREDDGISDVAIFGMPHATLGEELAAAVILHPNVMRTESDVRRFASERLADTKVPKRVLVVLEFPRTANGKVQHHELRQVLLKEESGGIARKGNAATLLEAKLIGVFEEVLASSGLCSDDDFFACGGDSLRAVRLVAIIQSLLSPERDDAILVRSANAEGRSRSTSSQEYRLGIPHWFACKRERSQSRSSSSTAIWRAAASICFAFAREIDVDRTVYSLSPHGTNGIHALDTIEAMATDYAALIERAYPGGPYLLGGYCNGGVVAYEIARLLRARGARVGPLLLVAAAASTVLFGALRRAVHFSARAFRWTPSQEALWFQRVRTRAIAFALLRGAPLAAYGSFVLEQARRIALKVTGTSPVGEQPMSEAVSRMSQALAHYFPNRYDGPVHLFWGQEDVSQFPGDPGMGWSGAASQVLLHRVPGDHLTIVTRESESLARIIRPLIAQFD